MNALIILAHGSRRAESNQEIIDLSGKVARIADGQYDIITHAYLEVVEPDLLQAIDMVMQDNVTEIIVMPYFLNSGNHVTRDIPNMVEKAKADHPGCSFKIAPCIGMHEDMPELLLAQAASI